MTDPKPKKGGKAQAGFLKRHEECLKPFFQVEVNAGGRFKFAVIAVLTKPGLTVRTLTPELLHSLSKARKKFRKT